MRAAVSKEMLKGSSARGRELITRKAYDASVRVPAGGFSFSAVRTNESQESLQSPYRPLNDNTQIPVEEKAMPRIVHIAIKVPDLEQATRFYEDVFGFRQTNT